MDRSGVNPHNHHSLHTVPLVQAVGISSSFLAASAHKLNDIVQEMASTEELVTWGLVPGVPEKEPEPGKEGEGPLCSCRHLMKPCTVCWILPGYRTTADRPCMMHSQMWCQRPRVPGLGKASAAL